MIVCVASVPVAGSLVRHRGRTSPRVTRSRSVWTSSRPAPTARRAARRFRIGGCVWSASPPLPREGGYLTRFVAACCAADAAAVKVGVRGQLSPGEGQWVEVVGTYQDDGGSVDPAAEVEIPRLQVQELRVVEEPRVPYL